MRRILSKILLFAVTLVVGLSVFAAAPVMVSAQDGSGDTHDSWGDSYGDVYYGQKWVYTGNAYYYYDDYYAGWMCEWAVYFVWRRADGSYYDMFDRYEWDWC